MKRALLNVLWLFPWLTALGRAQAVPSAPGSATDQSLYFVSAGGSRASTAPAGSPPVLAAAAALPRMRPEIALQVFEERSILQAEQLASYSATMLIRAQLPDTLQYGEYELQKRYAAPRTLMFKALRFTGDSFIKTNVILRLLQSEVEHLQKDDPTLTAITPANYILSYKETDRLEGRSVYVYQVKAASEAQRLVQGPDSS